MNFCKSVIYTTQNYDQKQYRKYKKKHNQKSYSRKQYFLRKSKAKKPWLNRDRHVRKYRNDRNYIIANF